MLLTLARFLTAIGVFASTSFVLGVCVLRADWSFALVLAALAAPALYFAVLYAADLIALLVSGRSKA